MSALRPGLALVAPALLLACPPATAQFSSDAGNNLVVGGGFGSQVQAKVVATADGGSFISWFDGGAGYDVRLQRLDSQGNELWGPNGVLIADRSFSSTQDHDLALDPGGNALLAFRDDRPGGVQVTACKVSPAGALLWGAGGVQLTATGDFIAAPKVAATASGEVVVAWTQNATSRLQRLDGAGQPVWAAPVILSPSAGNYTASHLVASGEEVILALVHQTGGFSSPKHLKAQKLDASGAALWGSGGLLSIFDGGSLQFGNFPTFVSDGAGGAVFAWYGTGPLQCYAQRVRSNGVELFPHNGVAVSTNLSGVRVAPSVAFEPASSSTFVFWEEQNGSQSLSGLSGQRLDALGNRQWGATGLTLVPLSGTQVLWVNTLATAAGPMVFWFESASFGQDTGYGAVLDPAGALVTPRTAFASTVSGKSRLAAALSSGGEAVLAWQDDRTDSADLLAQNFRSDGSLGAGEPGTARCFGSGCPCGNDDAAAGCQNSTGAGLLLGASGSTSVAADDLRLAVAGGPAGKPALLFQGTTQAGGGAGVTLGDGLRCAGGSIQRLSIRILDAGGSASWGPGLAASAGWSGGAVRQLQVWYRDPSGSPCGAGFNLSNGYEVSFTP